MLYIELSCLSSRIPYKRFRLRARVRDILAQSLTLPQNGGYCEKVRLSRDAFIRCTCSELRLRFQNKGSGWGGVRGGWRSSLIGAP